MSFWDDWSDGKKWAMGIASALIVTATGAGITGLVHILESETIPGGTGWVFGGYYEIATGTFTEGGAAFSISDSDRRPVEVDIGDIVRLGVARPVVIVDFDSTGEDKSEISPITQKRIGSEDLTGVELPAGTLLAVRDVSRGHRRDNPQAALWMRVKLAR